MSSLTPKRGFLADLFKSVGNDAWDLARVIAAEAVLAYSGVFVGAFIRGDAIDFSSIGIGFAAVLGGAGALIYVKDTARTAATSQISQDRAAGVVAEAVADHVADGKKP